MIMMAVMMIITVVMVIIIIIVVVIIILTHVMSVIVMTTMVVEIATKRIAVALDNMKQCVHFTVNNEDQQSGRSSVSHRMIPLACY